MNKKSRRYFDYLGELEGDDYWAAVHELSHATNQVASMRDIHMLQCGTPCCIPGRIHDAIDRAIAELTKK